MPSIDPSHPGFTLLEPTNCLSWEIDRKAAAVSLVTASLSHGERKSALEDIRCTIDPGEFVFLVGPTGSGKSSFLKLITREFKPDDGEVWVQGEEVTNLPQREIPLLRRKMGVVFQDFRLLPERTVFENVAFALRVIGAPMKEIGPRTWEAIRTVGLSQAAKKFPRQISGGEQQRTAIARAIVNRPPLLLADEPTGNLDPTTSAEIMDVLRQINDSGTTVIIATHDERMVDYYRKRVIALENGRIVRDEARGSYNKQDHRHLYPG